jgi:hypothetical protein
MIFLYDCLLNSIDAINMYIIYKTLTNEKLEVKKKGVLLLLCWSLAAALIIQLFGKVIYINDKI